MAKTRRPKTGPTDDADDAKPAIIFDDRAARLAESAPTGAEEPGKSAFRDDTTTVLPNSRPDPSLLTIAQPDVTAVDDGIPDDLTIADDIDPD